MLALVAAFAVAGVPAPELGVSRTSPAFQLLPGGTGAGVSQVHTELDQLFPSEFVGNWFFLDGTGRTAGPLALTPVGSPSSQVDRVCPNGPDCASLTSTRLNGSTDAYIAEGSGMVITDFSACALVRRDAADNGRWVTKESSIVGASTFALYASSVSVIFQVWKAGGTITTVAAGNGAEAGVWHMLCGTYDYVEDGTSIASLYLDGAPVAWSTTAVGPPQVTDVDFSVGRRITFDWLSGNVGLAFFTEKALSAPTIARMASAVLPRVQGSRGEAVTATRSTVRSCCTSAGCTLLPPNRPCVQGAALDVRGPTTNLLVQSEALDTSASWTGIGGTAPTVTANAAISFGGTLTAERIDIPAVSGAGAFSAINQQSSVLTNGASYTFSGWVKGVSGSGTVYFNFLNAGGAWSTSACPYTATAWTRCSVTGTAATGTNFVVFGVDKRAPGTADQPAQSVYAWGFQLEAGSVATSYCPTTTASATCNGDSIAIASPIAGSKGCVAATVRALEAWSGSARIIGFNSGGGSDAPLYAETPTRVGCWFGAGGSVVVPSLSAGPVRLVSRWANGTCTIEANGGARQTSGSAQTQNAPTTIFLGSRTGTMDFFPSAISDVAFSNEPEGCR